jgi:hypothetical protein
MSLRNVDWDFGLLEEFIEARGDDVIIETGVACTCRNGDLYASTIEREGAPASMRIMNCEKCQGDGWIFRNARIVHGLVTSIDPGKDKRLIETGYVIPGDAVFSPTLNEELLGDFDRITFLHPAPIDDGQVIMRGAAHLEENAQIDTDLEENEDRLWYMAACTIWCEDEDGRVYTQDADFLLDDRKLRWIGDRPNVGKLYTLKYFGYLEWVVYSQPFQRIDNGRNLGPRLLIRKKHVAFLTGSDADTPAKRVEEQALFTTKVKI